MKTIPFDYDKYVSTVPRPKVFTKGGIEVLDFHHRGDHDTWKLWGKLATEPTRYAGNADTKGLEGWTIEGKFTIENVSDEMKAFNADGLYNLVMSVVAEKVVYNADLKFGIHNVYYDTAKKTIKIDSGFRTAEKAMKAMEHEASLGKLGTLTYLGMFSLEGNPQFDQVLLANGLATIQKSNE